MCLFNTTKKTAAILGIVMGLAFAQTALGAQYVIYDEGGGVNVLRDGYGIANGSGTIQEVINAIKTDAAGSACTIQLGNGGTALDLGAGDTTIIKFDGGDWGAITLTGKATTASTANYEKGIIRLENGVSLDCKADLTATAGSAMILYASTGTLTISGGTISASSHAVYRVSTGGTINITGGTISATATNYSTIANYGGTLNMSGGTVRSTNGFAISTSSGRVNVSGGIVEGIGSGRAVYINSTGEITISGDALVRSVNAGAAQGTIMVSDGYANASGGRRLKIEGGTIENTAASGNAIYNYSKGGTIDIVGGIVRSTNGIAISNYSTGKITVSGGSLVSSANTNAEQGTIYLPDSGAATAERLEIIGGTVENTSSNGHVIYNASIGAVSISGGEITGVAGNAVRNVSTGALNIGGGTLTSAGDVITNYSTAAITVNGDALVYTTAAEIFSAIFNASTGIVNIGGNAEVSAADKGYAIASLGGKITVSDNALLSSANNLASYPAVIYLMDAGGDADTRLEINGGTVENKAVSGGKAVYNDSKGSVIISGGKVSVSATREGLLDGIAIYNASTGTLNISGGEVKADFGIAVLNESAADVNIGGTAKVSVIFGTAINNNEGTLNISGGEIRAVYDGTAVSNYSEEPFNISGGLLAGATAADSAGMKHAVYSSNEVNLTGGILFTYGDGELSNAAIGGECNPSGDAIIVIWNTEAGTTAYTEGASADIYKLPASASAVWHKEGDKNGILAVNGENTRFIALDVTVSAATPIKNIPKSDGRVGIRLSNNVVSERADIEVVLNDDKAGETKVTVYDNVGNVVFEKSVSGAKLSWNLTNNAGRNVANGTYLIIAQVKGGKGTYAYSTKVGVKR